MSRLPELAITGATGSVGGRVARRLAALGVAQRLIVRDVATAPELDGAVAVAASDFAAFEEMRSALDGVRTLFLVSAREDQDRLRKHLTAVDAASAAGVERIAYLSVVDAMPHATFTLARQHFATEQHIRASVPSFTFLRSNLYADFVPYFTGHDGVIRGPAGEGKVAWIARDDIAETVVRVVTETGHDGVTYDNTGPEALSLAETAEVLSRVTGRAISYHEETLDEAWESRRPSGAPEWEIEGWVSSYVAIADGEFAAVADSVERVTGVPAQALEPFLRDNPDLWRHLTD